MKVEEFTAGNPTAVATSTYRYDGLGRRIEKVGNGQTRRYVYDGEDILLEYDETNALLARYTHGPGIDEPVAMVRGGANYFYHQDGLGSVTELTDGAGATAKAYAYDAYGNILEQTGTVENPYAYTGRELDADTGLYYYRARYYDPRIGRFLQKDPIGFGSGSPNLYTYAFNSSVNLADPLGLSPCGCPPSDFKTNFARNLSTTNDFFFGFPENFTRTGIGLLVGSSATISNTVGTVTLGQAMKSVVLQGSGVANLGIANTLISGALNSSLGALAVGGSLEAGIIVGSAVDAALKSVEIDLSGCE